MIWFLFGFIISEVVILTDSNFTEIIESVDRKPIFVKFWVTWCTHCKEYAPIWQNFSQMNLNVTVAEIECEGNPKTCKKYASGGYPFLKWFEVGDSEGISFFANRDINYLIQFTNKQLHFPLQVVNLSESLENITQNKINSNFLFTFKGIENDQINISKTISTKLRSFSLNFYASFNETNNLSLVVYRGSNTPIEYKGDWTLENVNDFVINNAFPPFSRYSPPIDDFFYINKRPLLVMIGGEEVSDMSFTIAENLSYSIQTTVTDCIKTPYFCKYTGADKGGINFILWHKSRQIFWTLSDEVSLEYANTWLKSILNGKLRGKGPGNWIFKPIAAYYYESYIGGTFTFIQSLLIPPFCIGAIILMYLDLSGSLKRPKPPVKED